jgi:hypothetical protein
MAGQVRRLAYSGLRLATFDRRGIGVQIFSAHGGISLAKTSKHDSTTGNQQGGKNETMAERGRKGGEK